MADRQIDSIALVNHNESLLIPLQLIVVAHDL